MTQRNNLDHPLSRTIMQAVENGGIVVLCSDFDGTLAPLVGTPHHARIGREGLEAMLAFLSVEKELNALQEQGVDTRGLGRVELSFLTGRSFTHLGGDDLLTPEAMQTHETNGETHKINGLRELMIASAYEVYANEPEKLQQALALISALPCDHYHGMASRDREGQERVPEMTDAERGFITSARQGIEALYTKYQDMGYDFTACHEQTQGGFGVNFRAVRDGQPPLAGERKDAFDRFEQEARQLLAEKVAGSENPNVTRCGAEAPTPAFKCHAEAMSIEIMPAGLGDKGQAIAARLEDARIRWPEKEASLIFAGDSLRHEDGEWRGTDAPAFAEARDAGGLTIRVGAGDTHEPSGGLGEADIRVDTPEAFAHLLHEAALAYKQRMDQKIFELQPKAARGFTRSPGYANRDESENNLLRR